MKGVYSIRVSQASGTMMFTFERADMQVFSAYTGSPIVCQGDWLQVQHGDITMCCAVNPKMRCRFRKNVKDTVPVIKDVLHTLEGENLEVIAATYEDRLEWAGILVGYEDVRDFIRWAINHGGKRVELRRSVCGWDTIHMTYLVHGVKVSIVHHI